MTSHTSSSSSIRTGRQTVVVTAALICWSLLMLWLCWWGGARFTYYRYLDQWQLLLDGGDPWLKGEEGNTYGPLYTVIGFLLPWGPLAPKFFMVGALLVANAALVLE